MSKLLTTEAELRRAFPKASHWLIKLWLAYARDGGDEITFESRIPREDFEAAVAYKLSGNAWPWKPPDWKPSQALGAAATIALERAIRPRRTGKPRGRPRLHLDRVVAEIHACFDGQRYYDEGRLSAIATKHLGSLTVGQRTAILCDLETIAERQGRRADWRRWLRRWRRTLKPSGKH